MRVPLANFACILAVPYAMPQLIGCVAKIVSRCSTATMLMLQRQRQVSFLGNQRHTCDALRYTGLECTKAVRFLGAKYALRNGFDFNERAKLNVCGVGWDGSVVAAELPLWEKVQAKSRIELGELSHDGTLQTSLRCEVACMSSACRSWMRPPARSSKSGTPTHNSRKRLSNCPSQNEANLF